MNTAKNEHIFIYEITHSKRNQCTVHGKDYSKRHLLHIPM